MEDEKIIDLFFDRNEEAIAESDKKYGGYLFTLSNNILENRQDSEEIVSDVYLRAWNAIPPDRPSRLGMFLARITRNLSFNRYNDRSAKKRGGGETAAVLEELARCIPCESPTEQEYDGRALRESICRFIDALPEREACVFLRRYFYAERIQEIAGRYSISENHVSVILSRTRGKLMKRLIAEGFFDEQE